MAPFNLQGLNVVQPPHHDAQDLAAPFPDFSAHLDLWTNLAFESDEPLASVASPKRKLADGDDTNQDPNENVASPAAPSNPPPPLDVNALLAGFGIDPLLMLAPPSAPPLQQNAPPPLPPVPSLAQLLALHAAHYPVPVPAPQSVSTAPSAAPPSNPSKRTRTHRASPSVDSNADPRSTPPAEEPAQSESNAPVPVLSSAEDKRRRNTAASARFRLKKKEREAALERRAKELDERVVELERECEALRRENGWLKGLVVGVTGAGAVQHQQAAAK